MDRQHWSRDSELTPSEAVVLDGGAAASNPNDFNQSRNPSISSSTEQKETGGRGTLKLAYRTLGVVFGGLVTSPLYVYPSMVLKSPTEDDYLGIYSIMFWTLSLIGVIKYATIALKADDQGEGSNHQEDDWQW